MPGAGKSTIGIILAKFLSRDFLDTDVLIQVTEGRSLQDIIDKDGYLALRAIEERVLLDLHCKNHIIATGGSAVYSNAAMEYLKQEGIVVFLDVDIAILKKRLQDIHSRGLVKRPEQSLDDLYAERLCLYKKYADITVLSSNLSQENICDAIIKQLNQ